ncbi:MAG TPA: hypothetical protein VLA49_13170 [Anaerolineales bacterium]|nr:hypothetical protein [Anaerolineales bacterium]
MSHAVREFAFWQARLRLNGERDVLKCRGCDYPFLTSAQLIFINNFRGNSLAITENATNYCFNAQNYYTKPAGTIELNDGLVVGKIAYNQE